MNRKIILASESANRRSVLNALNVIYEALPARIDEKTIRDEDLAKRAEKLARAKAEKLAKKYPDAIILAGDSFPLNNGKVFEKPSTIEEARLMLRQESGGKGKFYNGFCYIDKLNNINFSTTVTVDFSLRTFTDDEIERYIEVFPVLTWSGALFVGNIYGAGMVKEISGSFSAFIYGLPMELVIEYLRKSGIDINP
ncbi:MAG: hypothetical protein A2905_01290 [Candidatus Levybacteria bacterium RIFCSPLOWO2_01_FULL_36_10]|nr:MAG: hypothetical protein A2905_01290 [Candidatus Levybacteria bacterium RIFCSPLOWO2_01_FULL_36_10]